MQGLEPRVQLVHDILQQRTTSFHCALLAARRPSNSFSCPRQLCSFRPPECTGSSVHKVLTASEAGRSTETLCGHLSATRAWMAISKADCGSWISAAVLGARGRFLKEHVCRSA